MMQLRPFLVFGIIMSLCGSAQAISPDGDLSDWGVDLSSALGGTESAWVPSSATAQWKVEDNIDDKCTVDTGIYGPCVDWTGYSATGVHIEGEGSSYSTYAEPHQYYADSWGKYDGPAGGEAYDLEALYFDDMNGYAFFAIVTSMGESGHTDQWGRHTDTGDLALDMDNDGSTGMYGYEYGIKTYGPDKGQVCYMPVWTQADPFVGSSPVRFNCNGANSQVMGKASLAYSNTGIMDNGFTNYVIEIRAPKYMIGMPAKDSMSDIHTTITCGNDVIDLKPVKWHFNAPEFPGVLSVLAIMAIAPCAAYLAKKE